MIFPERLAKPKEKEKKGEREIDRKRQKGCCGGMSPKVKELVDFDYKVFVTLSSDKVEGVSEPSVRLQLQLDGGEGEGRESHLYELNEQELTQLLNQLQELKSST